MTIEQYETLLGELANIIKSKESTIKLQEWQIEDLKKKLENAEVYKPKTNETK
jgi:hypothetical protein